MTNNVPNGTVYGGYSPGPEPLTAFSNGGMIQNQLPGSQAIQYGVNGASDPQAIQAAEDAAYHSQTQYLDPQWAQQSEQEQANLTAQGLNPNDAAYQNAMTSFNNAKTQAYGAAQNAATLAGEQEQNTLFGQNVASGQFANQAQGQGFGQGVTGLEIANAAQNQAFGQNQAMAGFYNTGAGQIAAENQGLASFANTATGQQFGQGQANAQLTNQAEQQQFQQQAYAQELPINEYTALENGAQVQAPQSTPAQTSVAPTDVLGAYALNSQVAEQNYQNQLQSYNSGLGGLFNLGSAVLGGAAKGGFLFGL